MKRRLYNPVLTVWALFWIVCSAQAEFDVPVSDSLQQDGVRAQQRQLPIMLTFSAIDCPYCRQLEQDFLGPMLISGEYTDRVIIRRLILDDGSRVTDFDGQRHAVDEIAGRYKAWLTPTIVFIDGSGREVAGRIVGINTPELFGGYLDACIDTALLRIRDPDSTVKYAGCDDPGRN
ncbi:MAG: thioredoxin fold domain-containing protein [Gammaproteobacteria bacterium]|nr:thioredoxin fold domain-containing protein [Gammaproteobacteria bacterium]